MCSVLSEPSVDAACDLAHAWGLEDALVGLDNNAAAYYIPDSPEWHAYAVGYLHGQQQATRITQDAPPTLQPVRRAYVEPLANPPGLWALRGYEDALFERPIRSALPDNATDRRDYLQGYAEGAAMLLRILSAPPPLAPAADDQPIFYFKESNNE